MKTYADKVRRGLGNRLFLHVHAEEITPEETPETKKEEATPEKKVTETPKPSGNVNFEDLVRKAREEEKAKLYPQLEKLKTDKNDLLLVVEERDQTIATLTKERDKFKEQSGKLSKDLETGTKTNKTVSDLTLQITQLERQMENLTAEHEKEVNALKIDTFKEKQIAKAQGKLIPELVTGDTEEEVLESLERAKVRYEDIFAQAVNGTQMPYTNPNSASIQLKAEATEAEISQMNQKEYAAYRQKIGLK